MGHDFQVEYKKGGENMVANALSHRFDTEPSGGSLFALTQLLPYWLGAIKDEVKNQPFLQILYSIIQQGEAIGPWRVADGVILFKERIFLPLDSKLTETIINEFHGITHKGYVKTFQRIKVNFWWKEIRRHIKEFICGCDIYQRHKNENLAPAGLLQPLPNPSQIWEDILMDFIEGFPLSNGKSTIFVVVDRLSKYAHFLSLSHPCTAIGFARVFFDNIFKLHGMPKSIVCDRYPTFTSAFWIELFNLNGTSFNFISSYHPQTDGQSRLLIEP